MPRVSLCVPTLNRGATLVRTLQSLVRQTFDDLEVIVLDNASDDDAAEQVVRSLGDERVRYLRQSQRVGMGANWNRALAEGRGTFKAVFHDDDVYHPDFVERLVRRFDSEPALAFVHAPTNHVDEVGRFLRVCDHGWPTRVSGAAFRRRMALHPKRSLVEAQTVMARASAWAAAGPFLEDWVQATDAEMWIRLSRQGEVGCLDAPAVDVQIRSSASDVTMRVVQALSEKVEVAELLRRELDRRERVVSRTRWDAALTRELLAIAAKGAPEVRRAARDRLVPTLSPGLRHAIGAVLDGGPADVLGRALRGAVRIRRQRFASR